VYASIDELCMTDVWGFRFITDYIMLHNLHAIFYGAQHTIFLMYVEFFMELNIQFYFAYNELGASTTLRIIRFIYELVSLLFSLFINWSPYWHAINYGHQQYCELFFYFIPFDGTS
jgi:hypothetical protein